MQMAPSRSIAEHMRCSGAWGFEEEAILHDACITSCQDAVKSIIGYDILAMSHRAKRIL